MATNETLTLSNGQTMATPSTKRKTARKSTTAGAAATKKAVAARAPAPAAPMEILFTQEPNPYLTPTPPYLWIDFPQENERLSASEYVIRLGVGGAEAVQISIDKGSWLPCRLNSGYWWYDWSGFGPGKHSLVARMRATDGRWFKTPARSCQFRP